MTTLVLEYDEETGIIQDFEYKTPDDFKTGSPHKISVDPSNFDHNNLDQYRVVDGEVVSVEDSEFEPISAKVLEEEGVNLGEIKDDETEKAIRVLCSEIDKVLRSKK